MQLRLQNFNALVQGMAASLQASATQILDLTVGSTLRAILEASASVGLWMQWLILQVLQMTRASTSNGADLDSWMADFSLVRRPAAPASGMVTFSRFTPTTIAVIPAGTLVRTADGSQTFAVVAETGIPAWDSPSDSYVMGSGVSALDVPAVAQTAGTCGNVQAATITMLATALAGVDSVSNADLFSNGLDAESDTAFRLRFQTYLASLSRATIGAIENAISSVQQGLSYTIQENQNVAGGYQLGNFVITVDDGSGYPSNALLASVRTAVDAVRPVGSTFSVIPPVVTQVSVSLAISTSANSSSAIAAPPIVAAITSYIDALPIGSPLPASRIVQLAYSGCSDITNVTQVLLNGTPADLSVEPTQVLKAAQIVVS